MRKALRVPFILSILLAAIIPVSGLIEAQSGDCALQNGVLIGTLSTGINCLDAGGWYAFEIRSGGIPVSSLDDVAICPDDHSIVALNIFGVNKFDGSNWSDVDVPSDVFAGEALPATRCQICALSFAPSLSAGSSMAIHPAPVSRAGC